MMTNAIPASVNRKCGHVEAKEAALFTFVVNDVQSIEERCNSRIGAAYGNEKGNNESRPKGVVSLLSDKPDLIRDDFKDTERQQTREKGEVLADSAAICDRPVKRDNRRDCREDSEEGKKRNSSRGRRMRFSSGTAHMTRQRMSSPPAGGGISPGLFAPRPRPGSRARAQSSEPGSTASPK